MQKPEEKMRNPEDEIKKIRQQLKKTKKKKTGIFGFLLFLALFILVLGGIGYYLNNVKKISLTVETTSDTKAVVETTNPNDSTEQKPSLAPKPGAISVSAEQILRDFQSNAAKAELDYSSKLIAVSGKIRSIEAGPGGTYIVSLGSGKQLNIFQESFTKKDVEQLFYSVKCTFNSDSLEGILKLRVDDYTTITGVCSDVTFYTLEVNNCKL